MSKRHHSPWSFRDFYYIYQIRDIPLKLKIAKITQIFKSDDETDANNYRPISLMSNFNTIFEKVVYKKIITYIENHDLLYSSQCGFRKGHSTQNAILDIVDAIQTNKSLHRP